MVRTLGVIPARLDSTRFPGKILAPILGKPMIQHVWEACSRSTLDGVFVATDSEEIHSAVMGFGGQAILTPAHFQSGTDRVAWAAERLEGEIIVNIQGDEPLIEPSSINALIGALREDANCEMATLCIRSPITPETLGPNTVKVTRDKFGNAVSFTRTLDANTRAGWFFKHIGLYAFRRESLFRFCALAMTTSEKTEKLEQLRALGNGMRIRVLEVDRDTIAVDVPEDIGRVEMTLMAL